MRVPEYRSMYLHGRCCPVDRRETDHAKRPQPSNLPCLPESRPPRPDSKEATRLHPVPLASSSIVRPTAAAPSSPNRVTSAPPAASPLACAPPRPRWLRLDPALCGVAPAPTAPSQIPKVFIVRGKCEEMTKEPLHCGGSGAGSWGCRAMGLEAVLTRSAITVNLHRGLQLCK
ncbi:hypothetical protein U9M48_016181 [Paspalum notatum var. saurae]|uniref:Uncharacterized protein n=1 Tax=Paspalum notatum var. saurae TaxID=547442 RepID=A0AAQ3T6Q0_PASNO